MGSEIVFGLPDQLPPVERDDERAGGSNMKPTAKRREEMHQECRQHEVQSAAVAVSRIGGTLYRCFLNRVGFGRAPPVARPRAKWIDTFRNEHTVTNTTERKGWM